MNMAEILLKQMGVNPQELQEQARSLFLQFKSEFAALKSQLDRIETMLLHSHSVDGSSFDEMDPATFGRMLEHERNDGTGGSQHGG